MEAVQKTVSTKRERPILFSGPMVRAILEGRKTETRRVVKVNPIEVVESGKLKVLDGKFDLKDCPYGQPGDLLYVRETWRPRSWGVDFDWMCIEYRADKGTKNEPFKLDVDPCDLWGEDRSQTQWAKLSDECRKAGCEMNGEVFTLKGKDGSHPIKWRPSIFMPKMAARLKLEITQVSVERLQNISEESAKAEGVDWYPALQPVPYFEELWNSINAKREGGIYSWKKNPFVWVVKFEKTEK